jgi:hypothetical protein
MPTRQQSEITEGIPASQEAMRPGIRSWVTFTAGHEKPWFQLLDGQVNTDWPFRDFPAPTLRT